MTGLWDYDENETPPTMKLQINGEERTFPDTAAQTLAALIESLNMKSDRVAVELNREIVSPRSLAPNAAQRRRPPRNRPLRRRRLFELSPERSICFTK